MKRLTLIIIFLGPLFFGLLRAQTINSNSSEIQFQVTSLMINRVEGTFKGMKGDIVFDEANLANSSFNVCVDPNTVDTGIEKRDDHLRTEDFFHVEKYPTICFVSTSISRKGNDFITKGNLTIHGVTKEVSIPFTFQDDTFQGSFDLKRFDYDVGKDISTFTVATKIAVTIVCKVE